MRNKIRTELSFFHSEAYLFSTLFEHNSHIQCPHDEICTGFFIGSRQITHKKSLGTSPIKSYRQPPLSSSAFSTAAVEGTSRSSAFFAIFSGIRPTCSVKVHYFTAETCSAPVANHRSWAKPKDIFLDNISSFYGCVFVFKCIQQNNFKWDARGMCKLTYFLPCTTAPLPWLCAVIISHLVLKSVQYQLWATC